MSAARRSGVHSLDHFGLTVPDLAIARQFYSAFGLKVVGAGDALDVFAHDSTHRWMRLIEGARKRLHHVSFGAFAEDLPDLIERLGARGVVRHAAPVGFDADGFWFRAPQGHLFQLRIGEKTSPDTAVPPLERLQVGEQIRPRRLSHVILFTADVPGSVELLTQALGLHVSHLQVNHVAFLYAGYGSDHHIVAFCRSHGPGFHHCGWEVASRGEVELGALQMARENYTAGFGLGRHAVGGNYYHYVRDPWGSYCEYTSGLQFVPAGVDYIASGIDVPVEAELPPGGQPSDFVVNYEMQ